MSDMKGAIASCIESVANSLAVNGNFVTENTFVEVLRTLRKGTLATATGWRQFLIETFKLSPPKKVFVNPYKKAGK